MHTFSRILFRFFLPVALLLCLSTLLGCNRACEHPTLTQIVTDPTCEEGGYTLNECTKCGARFQSNPTEPLGHKFKETTVSASCDEGGHTVQACSRCKITLTVAPTEPTGHTLSTVTVEPTCTEQGYTSVSCSHCDFSYQANVVEPTGHHPTTSIQYPTRSQNGSVVKHCACGVQTSAPLLYSDVFTGAAVSNTAVLAKGVDVSLYQHTVVNGVYQPLNWTAIKSAGFDFAILKAGSTPRVTNGVSKGGMDAVFEMNYRDAKAAGMELGVYFYTYATTLEQVKSDVELLLTWMDGKQLEYPVYFDLEEPSLSALGKETLTEFCVTFLSMLQENGYYGALYSNNPWLNDYLDGASLKADFDVWYARYPEDRKNADNPVPVSLSYTWNSATYGTQMGMWQYTNYGIIEGIDESIKFDFNYAYRDYPSIIKRFGYNGFPAEI